MKHLVAIVAALALAVLAMAGLAGPANAATEGGYSTNRTVTAAPGVDTTFTTSCDASHSHPDGGNAVAGYATFNETRSAAYLTQVSSVAGPAADEWTTTVHNSAARAYGYLSWADCVPRAAVADPGVIVVANPSDVPEGAVEDHPSTYADPASTCAVTRSWVLTVPGEHHEAVTKVVHHPAVTKVVHHDATTKVVHHDAVTTVVHHDAETHMQYHFRKFTETRTKPVGGEWGAYGPWTPWSPETHESWELNTLPIGSPDQHGSGTYADGTEWNRLWQAQYDGTSEPVTDKAAWDETEVTPAYDETVEDQAAYDETVVVKDAWDETVVVTKAYTDPEVVTHYAWSDSAPCVVTPPVVTPPVVTPPVTPPVPPVVTPPVVIVPPVVVTPPVVHPVIQPVVHLGPAPVKHVTHEVVADHTAQVVAPKGSVDTGYLPNTGAPANSGWIALGALVLLAGGFTVLRTARRR